MSRSDSDYALFRTELIRRVLQGMAPDEVAELLEVERERFPQITQTEIDSYRRSAA